MKIKYIAPKKFNNIQYDLYLLLQRCYYDTLTLNKSTVCINLQSLMNFSLENICTANYISNSLKSYNPINKLATNNVSKLCLTILDRIKRCYVFSIEDKYHLGYAILNTNNYPYDLILLYKYPLNNFVHDINNIFSKLLKINIFICGKLHVSTLDCNSLLPQHTTNIIPYTLFNTCIDSKDIHKILSYLVVNKFTIVDIDNISLNMCNYTSSFKSPLTGFKYELTHPCKRTSKLDILTYKFLYTI